MATDSHVQVCPYTIGDVVQGRETGYTDTACETASNRAETYRAEIPVLKCCQTGVYSCNVRVMRIRRITQYVIEMDSQESEDLCMALCSWSREMLPTDSPTQKGNIEKLARVLAGDYEVEGVEFQ